jgi:hypothetical protein
LASTADKVYAALEVFLLSVEMIFARLSWLM